MAFTKTPMSDEERKARKLASSTRWYHAHIEEARARQNARKQADPEKTAAQRKAYRAANPERYREYDRIDQTRQRARHPWRSSFNACRKRARKKGLNFTLTHEWAIANYTGYCALTGLPFDIRTEAGKPGPRPASCSIDRIDQTIGYTPTNCRFILSGVNSFRGSGTDANAIIMAKALLERASS